VASVVVHAVAHGAAPSRSSLAALAAGRAIASELGATLHVTVAIPETDPPAAPAPPLEMLFVRLGRAGADRVELLPRADAGPVRWSRTGAALARLCRRLAPRLVLFGANDDGGDIAPRLAANLGSAFFANAQLCGDRREPALERYVDGRRTALRLRISALRVPLVATVGGGDVSIESGEPDVDVAAPVDGEPDGLTWLDALADPGAALDAATTMVAIGGATSPAEAELAGELARALAGELVGTASAHRRGLVPRERTVGLGQRRIAPRLYVACATSGSVGHLAAIAPATTIVALNRDPDAAIFRAARYGMVGELSHLLPPLVAAVQAAGAR
jgi:electron transfer flavoprotein alpha subunit